MILARFVYSCCDMVIVAVFSITMCHQVGYLFNKFVSRYNFEKSILE